jgi:3,4-dihydroxy 2-butanone 4-phosphate synthase/GTP cyclohydrolase II
VALVDVESGSADLIAAASSITAEIVNAMAVEGRGLPYLALSAERVDQLRLPPMAMSWDVRRKPFTISIEAREGVTTGISAADRARTMRVATSPDAVADDLVSPGHVFPLRAERPGALRQGLRPVEAALALVAGTGAIAGAAMTEILDDEGALAGPAYLAVLGIRIDVPVVTVDAVGRDLSV